MPWWIKLILSFLGIIGVPLAAMIIFVILASKEEDPNCAKAIGLDNFEDEELTALWEDENEK